MKKGVDYTGVNVVFFCHDGQGNFIMGKRTEKTRDEHGRWDLGGGAVEFGEKIEDALRREIREEYGTEVIEYEFLGIMDVHRVNHNKERTHWVALCHKVLVDRKTARNAASEDHEEIGWFTLGNLPDPVHSQLSAFLSKFGEKLR